MYKSIASYKCGLRNNDTLLVTVIQTGAACHTGNHSCLPIWKEEENVIRRFLIITGKVLLAPFLFCLFWISRIFGFLFKDFKTNCYDSMCNRFGRNYNRGNHPYFFLSSGKRNQCMGDCPFGVFCSSPDGCAGSRCLEW